MKKWRCTVCGYVHTGDSAPERCPLCGATTFKEINTAEGKVYACEHHVGDGKVEDKEIMEGLRGHTSGYAVPTFVVDAPGGGGKTPVMPQYVISQTPHKVILRNYEGIITTYTEPSLPDLPCNCDYCTGKKTYKYEGVSALGEGPEIRTIEPAHLARHERNKH